MRTLVVGAGATGGYLGARLLDAGRDVTFLVRPRTAERLALEGLRVRGSDGTTTTHEVSALTADRLHTARDLVVVAVRGAALASAVGDLAPAMGPGSQVLPLLNGVSHLGALSGAFGPDAVLGATARLAATLLPDGTIIEQAPGAALEIGRPRGPHPGTTSSTRSGASSRSTA
ncbi:ketopantoate reductase family protein [Actinomycetospora sp. CA-053990]|uniref:ketopantoate reductase family protein n=1 Tax=Actinomycetospora sp. CA-053990 TaxID=3239891 RepID=UPI003D89C99A